MKKSNSNKNVSIEIIRIISAFGIVYFHSGLTPFKDVAYSGLIVFVIISLYFLDFTKENLFSQKTERLLIPYIFWFIFYGLFSLYKGGSIFPENYNIIQIILCSPSIHLWFLPFLLIIFLSISQIKKRIGLLSWIIAIVLLLTSPLWRKFDLPDPLGQYLHVLPAVFIGIFFRDFYYLSKKLRIYLYFSLLIIVILLAVSKLSNIGVTYLFGFLLSSPILLKNKISIRTNLIFVISYSTFGIYLLHPFILSLSSKIGIIGFSKVLFTYFSSMALIIVFQRITRYFNSFRILQKIC